MIQLSPSGSSNEESAVEESPVPRISYYFDVPGELGGAGSGENAVLQPSDQLLANKVPSSKLQEDAAAVAALLNQSIVFLGAASDRSEAKVPNPEVSTLVFFDLETTGLANFIGKSNVQITELSMIAVSRKDFENSKSPELKDIRIKNKLSLCVKPRSRVSPVAAKLTGLSDFNLQEQKPFDEGTAQMVCNFLARLPEPACLLAHNGDVFDFPLLVSELSRLKMIPPSSVFIADTLHAFRSFDIFDSKGNGVGGPKKTKSGGKSTSHSLANLYLHFFNKRARNSHSSETDCLTLMMVSHKMKEKLLPWVDENKKPLTAASAMW